MAVDLCFITNCETMANVTLTESLWFANEAIVSSTAFKNYKFGYNTIHLPAAVVGGDVGGGGIGGGEISGGGGNTGKLGGGVSAMQINIIIPTWYHILFLLGKYS